MKVTFAKTVFLQIKSEGFFISGGCVFGPPTFCYILKTCYEYCRDALQRVSTKNMDKILYQNKFRIPTIRLQSWDYSQDGWYFVTICTKKRKCYLGHVRDYGVNLSVVGKIVKKELLETAKIRENIEILEYIIMPNHVHAIFLINRPEVIYLERKNRFGPMIKGSLSATINYFKGQVKRECNRYGYDYFQWQPRFYEHIIRNEKALHKISQYIIKNPAKWEIDENNPKNFDF